MRQSYNPFFERSSGIHREERTKIDDYSTLQSELKSGRESNLSDKDEAKITVYEQ